jgi:hypothetical protein
VPDSEFDTPDSILVVEWVEFPGQGLAKAVRVLAGPVEAKPSRGFSPTPPLPTRPRRGERPGSCAFRQCRSVRGCFRRAEEPVPG